MATTPKAPKTDVATAASTAVQAYDYGDGETGFEEIKASDYSIPYLQLLQPMSPELKENKSLKMGDIMNTVTGEIFAGDDGIAFIPVYWDHNYVEWVPRDKGGGLVGKHALDSDVVKHAKEKAGTEFGKLSTPEGNDLIETRYAYGLGIEADGSVNPAVISFTSTKIKVAKNWITKAAGIQLPHPSGVRKQAPLFSHRYRLKVVTEKNSKGEFYNWGQVVFDGDNAAEARLSPTDPLLIQARDLRDMIKSGAARAADESLRPGGGDDGQQDGNGASGAPQGRAGNAPF